MLYAVDEITGQIQQLDDSTAQLTPVGPLISVHARVTTPSSLRTGRCTSRDGAHKDVLIVNTATRHVRRVTMPRESAPNQLIVQDRLVFVNASDGPSALVISGYNKAVHRSPSTPSPGAASQARGGALGS